MILTNVTQTLGLAFARQIASSPNLPGLMSTAPSLVTLPVNYVVYDLRPFDVSAYVLVACRASVTKFSSGHPPLILSDLFTS